jgi:hypothetical protein
LEKLLVEPRAVFSQRSDLAYGEAGSLIVYLRDKGLLKPFYETFVRNYAADPSGRRALESVTSMSVDEIQSDWRDRLSERVAPSRISR